MSPYFRECFAQRIEERHADESLAVTQIVLKERPELLPETLHDARIMADALDGVWAHLDRIVRNARRRARNNGPPRYGERVLQSTDKPYPRER